MNHNRKLNKLKNMKRYLLIFALLLGAVCSNAQSATDKANVLQQCFALPQFTQHYKLDPTGVPLTLYAVATNVQLPQGLDISYNGCKAVFGTQAQMEAINADAYVSFLSFIAMPEKIMVSLDYAYQCSTNKQVTGVELVFSKTAGQWVVSETKETRR